MNPYVGDILRNMEPFVVEQDSPLSVWGQIQRDLHRRMELFEFRPGMRLPSENELAAHYGVSRMTVRRAIEGLITDGYLRSKRGSGTFVTEGNRQFDVDLLRPWREQLLATGHVARSRLTEYSKDTPVAHELLGLIEHDGPQRFVFGLHTQEVDGIPIAITESWLPATNQAVLSQKPRSALVSATGSIRISFVNRRQARLLNSPLDVPLLEMTTGSRLRETGELVELARTSWIASRVRLNYGRTLAIGQIDMSELLSLETQRE
jgi:DNA-binding GntR family transcriptional regulator